MAWELQTNDSGGWPVAIPGYEFGRALHRGSQGVVFEALQRGTGRTVAIKLISDGLLAAPTARARFQREVHILARLRHPAIVTVHDSGTSCGSFYYVMDFVRGRPLDEHVEKAKPSTREIVALFEKVCAGINAAHLHGVIHRDLKPRNVLVNEQGEPVVIDFGLARPLLEQELGNSPSPVTRTGEFLGSLPWASPEQAEAEPSKVDLRTDVYAIGVMMYQLLTGRFPYTVSGKMQDVLRNIECAEARPLRQIRPEIDEDLQTIVLTALKKDPERRYQSAGELARDLRLYLRGEAIQAKRDNTLYLLGKKLRRHRRSATAIAALIVIVLGFGIGLATVDRRSRLAERKGIDIQFAFMERALEALDPGNQKDPRDDLEKIASRVSAELEGYPSIQAPLLERIGNVFRRLSLLDAAKPYLERAVAIRRELGAGHRQELGSSVQSLASLYWAQGKYDRAKPLYEEALNIRQASQSGPDADVATVLNHLAACAYSKGNFKKAVKLFEEALAIREKVLGTDDPDTAATRSGLATCLMESGAYDRAETLYRQALSEVENASEEALTGAERPQYLARALSSLGAVLVEKGEINEARNLLRRALDIKSELIGPNHTSTASTLSWLARAELNTKNFVLAQSLAEKSLAIRRHALPKGHPDIAVSLDVLARVLMARGQYEDAEKCLREAYEIQQTALPEDNWRRASTASALGECLVHLHRYEEAEPFVVESVPVILATRGPDDTYAKQAQRRLAEYRQAADKGDLAQSAADLDDQNTRTKLIASQTPPSRR